MDADSRRSGALSQAAFSVMKAVFRVLHGRRRILHSGENGLYADQKRDYLEGARAAIYRGNPGPRAEEAAGGGRRPGSAWKERGLRSLEMTRKNDSKYGSWKPRGPKIET